MKPINFIIKIDVYPFDVMVSIGQSDKQLANSLEKYALAITEEDYRLCKYTSDTCQGRAAMLSSNASMMRLRKLPKSPEEFGALAHEIFHIASFIMYRTGIKLKINYSDEAYSYLIGFLTKRIYEETNKYY